MARLICTCLCLVLVITALPSPAASLRIAVAANFKPVLDELADRFEQKYRHRVLVSSASSGILYNQISHGAPFDLFLSADDKRPRRLEQDDQIVPGSRHPYAFGRLVLWGPSLQVANLQTLESYQGRLAIANPALAPYGVAAEQTLKQLNLWQSCQARLVQGASIQQAWQFVASGNARLGLVAMAQVRDQPESTMAIIPESYYEPIRQELVILQRGNKALAQQFKDFLLGEKSQKFIAEQGYKPANQNQ